MVLHYTAMADCEAALQRLCTPEHEVSAHYLVSEAGEVIRLVDEDKRAWHAGAGAWGDVTDVNSRSIGIELDNPGDRAFAEAQMVALEALLADLIERHDIPPERVIGHSDMAPGRKTDPGPLFDWQRLARSGLSVWPEAEPVPVPDGYVPGLGELARFAGALFDFGYRGDAPAALFRAFRARFRPEAGPFEPTDLLWAEELASRFPVDRRRPGA